MADEMSKSEAVAAYQRVKGAVKRARDEAERKGMMVLGTGTQVLMGGAMGMAEEYFGERAVLGLNIPMVVGAASGVAFLTGVGGEVVETLTHATANAGLTIESYKFGGRVLSEYRASQAAAQGGGGAARE